MSVATDPLFDGLPLVPSPAPQESGGVGATPSAEAVEELLLTPKAKQAPHDAARDWADLSGRWGHRWDRQHSAPIPEGLAGLGARGQEPVSPGPTVDDLREEVRRLTGWINDCARAARLPGGMEFADVAAGIWAESVRVQRLADSRISEMRRRDEAIGRLDGLLRSAEEERDAAQHQLREALAQLAAVTAERDRWKAGAQAMAGVGLEWLGSAGSVAEQLAAVQAERDYERKRANEAIAQLHDARRELAAMRVRVADGGKVVKG